MKYYWHSFKACAKGPNKVLIRSNAKVCAQRGTDTTTPNNVGSCFFHLHIALYVVTVENIHEQRNLAELLKR